MCNGWWLGSLTPTSTMLQLWNPTPVPEPLNFIFNNYKMSLIVINLVLRAITEHRSVNICKAFKTVSCTQLAFKKLLGLASSQLIQTRYALRGPLLF